MGLLPQRSLKHNETKQYIITLSNHGKVVYRMVTLFLFCYKIRNILFTHFI